MANSIITKPSAAQPRASFTEVCGPTSTGKEQAHAPAPSLREVAAIAVEHTTIQKEAADQIGIHRARLSHKLKDGTLTLAQLEPLGPSFAVELGRMLLETFGPLATPQARACQLLREVRRALEEVESLMEQL